MNFLHDFTLFVVDIHQIMLSLFPTPFDHFHGSAGLVPKLILTLRHMLNLISILTLTFVSEKKVLPVFLVSSPYPLYLKRLLVQSFNVPVIWGHVGPACPHVC